MINYGSISAHYHSLSFLLWPVVSGADIYRYVTGTASSTTRTPSRTEVHRSIFGEGPNVAPGRRHPRPSGQAGIETWYVEPGCSRANDLPGAIIHAIIKAESNGQRKAVSRKGAEGCDAV